MEYTQHIFLVDLDGTMADCKHRLHFILKDHANWDAFFDACDQDEPIKEVISVVNALSNGGYVTLIVTGRSERCRTKTVEWLDKHKVLYDGLYMRGEKDYREDSIIKKELLEKIKNRFPYGKIMGAFEDRNQVVQMYRENGIRVFQVADGNY